MCLKTAQDTRDRGVPLAQTGESSESIFTDNVERGVLPKQDCHPQIILSFFPIESLITEAIALV